MGKRGAAHIEFILSLLLFIGIVTFALVFFNPTGGERVISSSLVYAFTEIIQNSSVRLDSFSVRVNVQEIIQIDVEGADGNSRVMSYDESSVLDSYSGSGFVKFDPAGENFVIARVSEGIITPGASLGSPGGSEGASEIASHTKKDIISEAKIKNLKDYYDENYENLKKNFNLPGIDFSFDLVFPDGSSVGVSKEIPEGLSVFSDSRRVEVLRENGEIIFGELRIKVW